MSAPAEPARWQPGGDPLDPLPSPVRVLFDDLRHAGELPPTAQVGRILVGEAGRAHQGTQVRFQLRIAAGGIVEARYRAYGCPYTLATCEWLARRLPQLTPAALSWPALAAVAGGALEWAESLGAPPERLGRLLIVEDALRAALQDA